MTACDIPTVGARVLIRCSDGDELLGYMTERVNYSDGTAGAFVQLDHEGAVVVVPIYELVKVHATG